MPSQPPIELVLGAPLQVREEDGETVAGVRTKAGFRELKRF